MTRLMTHTEGGEYRFQFALSRDLLCDVAAVITSGTASGVSIRSVARPALRLLQYDQGDVLAMSFNSLCRETCFVTLEFRVWSQQTLMFQFALSRDLLCDHRNDYRRSRCYRFNSLCRETCFVTCFVGPLRGRLQVSIRSVARPAL